MKNSTLKKLISLGLALSLSSGMILPVGASNSSTVHLGGSASYSTEPKGMATIGTADGGQTEVPRVSELAWLPNPNIEGKAYLTDDFLANNNTVPTTDWGTSFLWGSMFGNVDNPYSENGFAFPLAYRAEADGMHIGSSMWVQYPAEGREFRMPLEMTDYIIKPLDVSIPDAKVDKITDWSYDIVMGSDTKNVVTTMVQGSPYAYFNVTDDTQVSITAGTNWNTKALLNPIPAIGADWENEDGLTGTVAGENQIILQAYYPVSGSEAQTKRFLLSGPEGVEWEINKAGTPDLEVIATFPDGKGYFSMVQLPDMANVPTDVIDTYKDYAYNFVTDTRADYDFNQATNEVTNTFTYTVDKKAESTVDDILMGILPHQHKNMNETESDYLDIDTYTYRTVRGDMRFLVGSSFETILEYTGIIPTMPTVEDETDKEKLREYLYDFTEEAEKNGSYIILAEYGDNSTYWVGKAIQKAINLVPIAEDLGEFSIAEDILNDVKAELENWFSTDDSEQDKFFYYNEDVGTLIGYPASFGSDSQLNDHHFHYGYFIYTAAQIALNDKEWAAEWGPMVEELIADIASTDRDTKNSKYPYLRSFAPYESHSWASGHALFGDGNNHESSSEAMNAWAGIILWGEATENQELKDLGAYLYTGEMSAIENYWFDVDGDVLDLGYTYKQPAMQEDWIGTVDPSSGQVYEVKQNQAAMVWGSKYTYGTWWTAEPLQVQGINLLPLSSASFYLAKYGDYVENNYYNAQANEATYNGPDKMENPLDRWHDVWQAYLSLTNPSDALAGFRDTVVAEPGMTTAYTYNYMKAFETYGTPDLSVTTTDTMLANVFNKNGTKYYSAFNGTTENMTITFSDGATLGVKAGTSFIGLAGEDNFSEVDLEGFVTTFIVDGVSTEVKTAIGSDARVPSEPKKAGFKFTGWFTAETGGEEVTEFKTEQTVYAQFKVADIFETIFIIGNSDIEISTSEDQEIVMPNDPFIDGYSFKGWYSAQTGGDKVTNFTTSQVVYAQFEKNEIKSNMITNGDFSNDTEGFVIENPGGASTNAVENGVLALDITGLGGADWHVLLSNNGIPFEANVDYMISFDAWADNARDIGVGIENVGYSRVYDDSFDLTDEKETFTFNYTHAQNETLNFKMYLGATSNASTGKVYIDNIVIKEAPLAEGTETFATTFNVDGFETVVTTVVGEDIKMPANPTMSGIEFKGWFNEPTSGDLVTDFTVSQTVYAQFETDEVEPEKPTPTGVSTNVYLETRAVVADNPTSEFKLSLDDSANLANIEITLKTNGENISVIGKEGFSVLSSDATAEIIDGERYETFVLAYTGNSDKLFTNDNKIKVANISVSSPFAKISIEEIAGYGWNENLETISANVEIMSKSAVYGNEHDVNNDGKVDIYDISEIQKYYGLANDSTNWNNFKHLDVNDDNIIDIGDMLEIFLNYKQ